MKNILTLCAIIFCIYSKSSAQCNLNPSISPNNLIMCPDTYDTIWTQSFDHYQWYQNGNLIPAETLQYLVVNYLVHTPSYFTVVVQQNSCADTSEQELVDGWAFLPPAVQSGGKYIFDPNTLANLVCVGDTMHFKLLGNDYINIEWTKNNIPIPNQTSVDLFITADSITNTDVYHVTASTTTCPDYYMGLGVGLYVRFVDCTINNVNADVLQNIKIFPNPFSDFAFIENEKNLEFNKINILNANGAIIREIKQTIGNQIRLDRQELLSGFYFIEFILFDGTKYRRKIIITD